MENDMDFIKNCFDEFSTLLLIKLKEVGIMDEVAKIFLLETAHAILHTIKHSSLEKTIEILLSNNPSQILKAVNINQIAYKTNLDIEHVTAGLESITPVVSQVFTINSNELVAATASLAWKTTDESICLEGQTT